MELVWFRGHKWIKENLKKRTTYVVLEKSMFLTELHTSSRNGIEI